MCKHINKHVAFTRMDIITQIYSSPRLHVLLHLGKSRAMFSCVNVDQLSALHSSPPLSHLNINLEWDTIRLPGSEFILTGVFLGDSYL